MTTLEANRDYIAVIRHQLDLDDEDLATSIADYVVSELERLGSSNARLVMPVDEWGDVPGPCCSWCWSLGGLCPHIVGSGPETH